MRVALGSVEEEVADACARNVQVFGCHVGEDDAVRYVRSGPFASRLKEVLFAEIGEAEKPEDGFGQAGEDAEPGSEGCWFDLSRLLALISRRQVGATNLV